jgi:hypothetical protein
VKELEDGLKAAANSSRGGGPQGPNIFSIGNVTIRYPFYGGLMINLFD